MAWVLNYANMNLHRPRTSARVVDIIETLQLNPYEQAWAQRIVELQARLAPLERQVVEPWTYSILSLPLQTHVWFWNVSLLQTCVLMFMYGRLVPL